MRELIHKMWDFGASLLFPRTCFGCGKQNSYLCVSCEHNAKPQSYRLDSGVIVHTAFSYHDPGIQKALKQLKYRGSRDIAETLAGMLAKTLKGYKGSPFLIPKDYPFGKGLSLSDPKGNPLVNVSGPEGNPLVSLEIVAVPSTAARHRSRGFNQSELLGRALAAQWNVPFSDALEKIRETPAQTTLKRRERLTNLRGAFLARSGYRPSKTVIIVDDISTTGATLTEAARALKAAGAATIIGAVVAHG